MDSEFMKIGDEGETDDIGITNTEIEGGESMVNLWIFRLKIGLASAETVPTVYRIPVYVGAIAQGIITIEDVPANYQDRVLEAL